MKLKEKQFKEFFKKEFPNLRKYILRGDIDELDDDVGKLKKILKKN